MSPISTSWQRLRQQRHFRVVAAAAVGALTAMAIAYSARQSERAIAAFTAAATTGAVAGAAVGLALRRAPGDGAHTNERVRAVRVQMSPDLPPNRAHALLAEVVRGIDGVIQQPPPSVRTLGLRESVMEYEVEFSVGNAAAAPEIASTLATRLWYVANRESVAVQPPPSPEEVPTVAFSTLDAAPLFAKLPVAMKQDMARRAEIELWAAGERVVEQGAEADSCFIVRSGRLGVHVSDGKTETQVATLTEGDLFGEMSLLTGEPRRATVRADEDSEVVRISAPVLKAVLRGSPELVQVLAETVALRRDELARAYAFLQASGERAEP